MKKLALMSALAIGASSCVIAGNNPTYAQGTVVDIRENLSTLVRSEEARGLVSYSNETVKFGDVYIFDVDTPAGLYTIQLDPTDRGGSPGPQTMYNLAGAIEIGTNVKFLTNPSRKNTRGDPMGFSSSRIGMLDPDDVEIIR